MPALRFRTFARKVLIFCILSKLTKVSNVPDHNQTCLPSFFQAKISPFGITQVLYQLTLNSYKSLLSRYTAGYISDNNKHRIGSKVNIDKNITLFNSQVHLNGILCPRRQ